MPDAIQFVIVGAEKARSLSPKAPQAMTVAAALWGDRVRLADEPYAALAGADALCVMTEWLVYRNPDFARIRDALTTPVVIDGRNLYDPRRMADLGFRHATIGRSTA